MPRTRPSSGSTAAGSARRVRRAGVRGRVGRGGHARQAEHPLEVEAVRAAGIVAQGRVGQPALRRGAAGPAPARPWAPPGAPCRAPRHAPGGRRGRLRGQRRGGHEADRDRPVAAAGDRLLARDERGGRIPEQRRCEPVQHGSARARCGPLLDIDPARQDEPLLGAGGGDVEQPAFLRGLGRGQPLGDARVAERRDGVAAGQRRQPQARARPGADQQPLARDHAGPAEIGHADDGELQPLGAVDRHQPHGVEPLRLQRGLALARLGEVLTRGVRQEAAQVTAFGALVLAGEAHQLAQVGQPALAAGTAEDLEVVARRGDRALEQHLDRQPLGAEPLRGGEAGEGDEPVAVVLGQRVEPGARRAQGRPRAAAGAAARLGEQQQRVRPDAAEGRGEHPVERGLVERVGEHREVGDGVAHLRLRPVPAAADHVGGQALLLQRLLEQAQGARGADQHDDVPRRAAGIDLLAQPRGDGARLRPPPRLRGERGQAELGLALLPAARSRTRAARRAAPAAGPARTGAARPVRGPRRAARSRAPGAARRRRSRRRGSRVST